MCFRVRLFFLNLFLFVGAVRGLELHEKGDGDFGVSLGDTASTKLVRRVIDYQLRSPHLLQVKLKSANDVWFNDIARVDTENRIAIGSLEVRFLGERRIEAVAQKLRLNSSMLVSKASLPLYFLDNKNFLLNIEVERVFLQMQFQPPASLSTENCSLSVEHINLGVERGFVLNTLLSVLPMTMLKSAIRDRVCGILEAAFVDLRREYALEVPFKSVIPEKFVRLLQNDRVKLRSRIHSISAAENQIAVTAIMEWTMEEVPTTAHTSLADSEVFHFEEAQFKSLAASSEQISLDTKRPQTLPFSGVNASEISETIIFWVDDRLINDLLKQFRWDGQWINESIQLNSPRLPKETLSFFEVVCPQCFFLFNISADGLPDVQILADKSIIIRNRNRVTAAVLNPALGPGGKRRTALDLSMLLQLRLVPQIQNGIFRTHMDLVERKVEVKNESAFPTELYGAVEQLIQDFIAEDMWPVLQRELEPLIYQSGIQLPTRCGLDPTSAQLQFEQGRLGFSARLENDLEEVSFRHCLQQFKSGLPDASKLFNDLSQRKHMRLK